MSRFTLTLLPNEDEYLAFPRGRKAAFEVSFRWRTRRRKMDVRLLHTVERERDVCHLQEMNLFRFLLLMMSRSPTAHERKDLLLWSDLDSDVNDTKSNRYLADVHTCQSFVSMNVEEKSNGPCIVFSSSSKKRWAKETSSSRTMITVIE